MPSSAQCGYRVGDDIRVRRQRWRVTAVEGRTLTLLGVDRDNADEPSILLEPFERIEMATASRQAALEGGARWRTGRRRWRRGCRAMLCGVGPWTSLRSMERSDLTVWPHQLRPARALLEGRACRLLLADAVGLGKTIQAGIIGSELMARGAVASALVLCPAGLREQWQQELRQRFALDCEIVDCRSIARSAADLPLGVNPWKTLRLAIASIDYVKRPENLSAVRAVPWDLVIVDEAHGVSPGSDRYAAVAPLCAAALYVILVTATPHNGDREAFAALCRLGAAGDPAGDPCLVFRRTRADVRLAISRRVHQLPVRLHAEETAMHGALDRYASALRAGAREAEGVDLLLSVLRKRGLSSPASLRASVERRLLMLAAPTATMHQVTLPIDDQGEFDAGDEECLPPAIGLRDAEHERQLLEDLSARARCASAAESKLRALVRLLRRLARCHEPVIVFTEFRDTLLHVHDRVAPGALLLHGGLDRTERRRVVDEFVRGGHLVLLATDAGGEGLNLHHRCRCVVHLEVPWTPVRLEQRIGRVDRIGQSRRVHVFCLIARHPSEEHLVHRIRARVTAADNDVGMPSPLSSQGPSANVEPSPGDDDEESQRETGRIMRVRRLFWQRAAGRTAAPCRHTFDRRIVARCRPRLRAQLHNQGLALIEWVALDRVGRLVAADVVPIAVPVGASTRGRDRVGLVEAAGPVTAAIAGIGPRLVADFVFGEHGFATWRAFWATAARRAEGVVAAMPPPIATLFQPGLFDHRAERLRELRRDEHEELAALLAARAARLATACEPPVVVSQRLLLLLP